MKILPIVTVGYALKIFESMTECIDVLVLGTVLVVYTPGLHLLLGIIIGKYQWM